MHHDDLDLTDDLSDVATLLRQQRAELNGLELDHIKQRAMGLGPRSSTSSSTRKSTFMRSRSLVTALLASGIFITGGSTALGVSGLVASDSASVAQYGTANPTGTGQTLGATKEEKDDFGNAKQSKGNATPSKGNAKPKGETLGETAQNSAPKGQVRGATDSSPNTIQPARQLAATSANGEKLPFTGFAAVPILLLGLALLASGVFLRRFGQHSPSKL